MPHAATSALLLCLAISATAWSDDPVSAIVQSLGNPGVQLESSGEISVNTSNALLDREACSVNRYANHLRQETLNERWPNPDGSIQDRTVEAEIWTQAIQQALDKDGRVFIPARDKPYYLDAPIIMHSGNRLILDPTAEMRLKPGSNCCMVRNEHIRSGQEGPLSLGDDADTDIILSGGVWTTLAVTRTEINGNIRAGARASIPFNAHGVIMFTNIRQLTITDVTIRQCKPHGIQLSNCSQFCVANIRFEDQRRDGVHINGPASYGLIHDVRNAKGVMGDDMIALNAWDWMNTSMSFGPIHHILVDGVHGEAPNPTGSEGRAEIRLLAGAKHFPGGATLACNIEHCTIRGVRGIRTFKMYDQPNLELGRDKDFADPIGQLSSLTFQNIHVERPVEPALFQIAMNGQDIAIQDVTLDFEPPPDFKLVQVGPLSQTYKHNPQYPGTWVEIFSPDKDCTIKGLSLTGVEALLQGQRAPVQPESLIAVIEQKVNPDYPNTTPRGGTGKGILLP